MERIFQSDLYHQVSSFEAVLIIAFRDCIVNEGEDNNNLRHKKRQIPL